MTCLVAIINYFIEGGFMKEYKGLMITILLFTVVIVIAIGSRIVFSPTEAMAKQKTYKVVDYKYYDTVSPKYEAFLNKMSAEGWEFETLLPSNETNTNSMVFKK